MKTAYPFSNVKKEICLVVSKAYLIGVFKALEKGPAIHLFPVN